MAYIKTLKDNELIGGQDNTDVYPITSTQAVSSQKPDGTIPKGRKPLLEDRLEDIEKNADSLATRQEVVERRMDNTSQTVSSFDGKYTSITNELYSMVRSLQVGGIALSGKLGDREDIGIHQKTLSKIFDRMWNILEEVTGKEFIEYTLTVDPISAYADGDVDVTITVDCTESVSNFDEVKIYVNNELVGEAHDIYTYTKVTPIGKPSVVKVEGTIVGKTIIKEQEVDIETPFFMGSGTQYQDVMNEECRKELIGTLQGDYDVTVKHNGDYIFIIIPTTRREEFRRAKLDMNGFEIPIHTTERTDYIICRTVNTYQAGTYNIDIDINN